MNFRLALWIVVLAGCPTVDLGDTPEDIGLCNPAKGEPYFEAMVWPTFLNGAGSAQCTQGMCHANGGQGGALHYRTNPIDYQANFKFTQIYLNCDSPEASHLLTYPLKGPDIHPGGDIFQTVDDPAVQVFLEWFTP